MYRQLRLSNRRAIGQTAVMTTIGFLHTSQVHVATFRALVDVLAASDAEPVDVIDVVDELLLERARVVGARDLEVLGAVADRLAQLVDAQIVVCTCSTIGAIAEEIGAIAGLRVIRVDRPMVEQAVQIAARGQGRIAVVAAVESTVGSTRSLLDEVILATGLAVDVDLRLVAGAWERFEAGDRDGYLAAIAAELPSIAATADVVVLAQASMADAEALVDLPVPVLSSPRSAVEAVLAGEL
jgi:hypothetical protein